MKHHEKYVSLFFYLTLLFWVAENLYFGMNDRPESQAEKICDYIVKICLLLSVSMLIGIRIGQLFANWNKDPVQRPKAAFRVLAVIVCGFVTWGLVRICTHFINPMLPPPVAVGLTLLVWGGSTYLFMLNIFPILDKWLEAKPEPPKSNRPGETRFMDYRRPIADHLMPPDAGRCVGFLRLTIFENGFVTDGEYIPAEMVHNLAAALSVNAHLASELSAAVMAKRLFLDGKMNHPYVFYEKIVEAIKATCPCEVCQAKRNESIKN